MAAEDPGSERVNVVVGGGGGIGLACARALGGRLLIVDLHQDRLDAAKAELAEEGIEAETVACDVSSREAVAAAAARAAELGPLGALVHTAGIAPPIFTDGPRILEVNLFGTINVLDAFEPLVTTGSAGVCFASISAHRGFIFEHDELLRDPTAEGFVEALEARVPLVGNPVDAYTASKRAVVLMVERRSFDWGRKGGRLLSLSPGFIADTQMGSVVDESKLIVPYAELAAVGRTGRSVDIARVVKFLCSADAGYLSGTDILVDGGTKAGIDHRFSDEDRAVWHAAKTPAPEGS